MRATSVAVALALLTLAACGGSDSGREARTVETEDVPLTFA